MSEDQKKLLYKQLVKFLENKNVVSYEAFSAYVDQEFRYWLLNNILFMSVELYFEFLKK